MQNPLFPLLNDAPLEVLSSASQRAYWVRRARTQVAFARAFCVALPPRETVGWSVCIEKATAILNVLDHTSDLADLQTAVNVAEEYLAVIGETARNYRIHCVGHGHIDMNWMWSWPETVATTHDTFASVLRLMDEYDGFTYSQSQAAVYALTEKYFPLQFAEIQKRVKEGRWEVSAAHWVEGDKNLASGESLCRHLLLCRRYIEDKFGLTPEDQPVDWEPDTFGHASTVPSIVAQAAVKFYYACRTGGGFGHACVGNEDRPSLFWWEGPDGSRILVNKEITWYNSYTNIGDNIALPMTKFVKETGLCDWLNIYGIGNHGGGPTRQEIDWYRELQGYPIYPQVVWSTVKRYFQSIEDDLPESLPVLNHELNFEFTGCYTSQSLIKQANRIGENLCEEAETLAVIASCLTEYHIPIQQLRDAWTHVLFNQFHDILPGSGVRQTREHASGLFQEVGAITGSIKRATLGLIAQHIDTLSLLPNTPRAEIERAEIATGKPQPTFEAGAGMGAGQTGFSQARGGGRRFRPHVIYNPCTWSRSERVTVALYDTDFDPTQVIALDEKGNAWPTLFLGTEHYLGHRKATFSFDAHEIPALGYRTFILCEGEAEMTVSAISPLKKDQFETPFLRLRLDRFGSGISQLTDRRTGANLSLPNQPLVAWSSVTERPGGMTSWVLGDERDAPIPLIANKFRIIGQEINRGTNAVQGGGTAGVQAIWNLVLPNTHSTVRMIADIHALSPRIDFTAEIDWREIGDQERGIPGLTIRFPLALSNVRSRYEVPFGSVERSLFAGEEVPTLRYAHLEGQAMGQDGTLVFTGVTLLQDGKSGHSLVVNEDGCELRLRVVRSSFDPDPVPEVGQHTFRFALVFHDKPVLPSELTRLGAAWNHPLMIVPTDLQDGSVSPVQSFVRVKTPSVVLTALKPTEEEDGFVVRLVEMDGHEVVAEVEFDPLFVAKVKRVQLLDVLERPITGIVEWNGSVLRTRIQAFSFVTVFLGP